ncbi:hypothetical protein HY642_02625, partial [Candidatus Woesearchaeota archaeon]|nr:hypothetical protein [Candidatus Woesearchaeota archaeon]
MRHSILALALCLALVAAVVAADEPPAGEPKPQTLEERYKAQPTPDNFLELCRQDASKCTADNFKLMGASGNNAVVYQVFSTATLTDEQAKQLFTALARDGQQNLLLQLGQRGALERPYVEALFKEYLTKSFQKENSDDILIAFGFFRAKDKAQSLARFNDKDLAAVATELIKARYKLENFDVEAAPGEWQLYFEEIGGRVELVNGEGTVPLTIVEGVAVKAVKKGGFEYDDAGKKVHIGKADTAKITKERVMDETTRKVIDVLRAEITSNGQTFTVSAEAKSTVSADKENGLVLIIADGKKWNPTMVAGSALRVTVFDGGVRFDGSAVKLTRWDVPDISKGGQYVRQFEIDDGSLEFHGKGSEAVRKRIEALEDAGIKDPLTELYIARGVVRVDIRGKWVGDSLPRDVTVYSTDKETPTYIPVMRYTLSQNQMTAIKERLAMLDGLSTEIAQKEYFGTWKKVMQVKEYLDSLKNKAAVLYNVGLFKTGLLTPEEYAGKLKEDFPALSYAERSQLALQLLTNAEAGVPIVLQNWLRSVKDEKAAEIKSITRPVNIVVVQDPSQKFSMNMAAAPGSVVRVDYTQNPESGITQSTKLHGADWALQCSTCVGIAGVKSTSTSKIDVTTTDRQGAKYHETISTRVTGFEPDGTPAFRTEHIIDPQSNAQFVRSNVVGVSQANVADPRTNKVKEFTLGVTDGRWTSKIVQTVEGKTAADIEMIGTNPRIIAKQIEFTTQADSKVFLAKPGAEIKLVTGTWSLDQNGIHIRGADSKNPRAPGAEVTLTTDLPTAKAGEKGQGVKVTTPANVALDFGRTTTLHVERKPWMVGTAQVGAVGDLDVTDLVFDALVDEQGLHYRGKIVAAREGEELQVTLGRGVLAGREAPAGVFDPLDRIRVENKVKLNGEFVSDSADLTSFEKDMQTVATLDTERKRLDTQRPSVLAQIVREEVARQGFAADETESQMSKVRIYGVRAHMRDTYNPATGKTESQLQAADLTGFATKYIEPLSDDKAFSIEATGEFKTSLRGVEGDKKLTLAFGTQAREGAERAEVRLLRRVCHSECQDQEMMKGQADILLGRPWEGAVRRLLPGSKTTISNGDVTLEEAFINKESKEAVLGLLGLPPELAARTPQVHIDSMSMDVPEEGVGKGFKATLSGTVTLQDEGGANSLVANLRGSRITVGDELVWRSLRDVDLPGGLPGLAPQSTVTVKKANGETLTATLEELRVPPAAIADMNKLADQGRLQLRDVTGKYLGGELKGVQISAVWKEGRGDVHIAGEVAGFGVDLGSEQKAFVSGVVNGDIKGIPLKADQGGKIVATMEGDNIVITNEKGTELMRGNFQNIQIEAEKKTGMSITDALTRPDTSRLVGKQGQSITVSKEGAAELKFVNALPTNPLTGRRLVDELGSDISINNFDLELKKAERTIGFSGQVSADLVPDANRRAGKFLADFDKALFAIEPSQWYTPVGVALAASGEKPVLVDGDVLVLKAGAPHFRIERTQPDGTTAVPFEGDLTEAKGIP